jgi:hypothetical protein
MNNRQIVTPSLSVFGAPRTCYLVKWRGYNRVEDLTCEPRRNVHVPVAHVPSIDQSAMDYRVCAGAYRAPDHNAPFPSGPAGSTACELPATMPAGQCSVPPPHHSPRVLGALHGRLPPPINYAGNRSSVLSG